MSPELPHSFSNTNALDLQIEEVDNAIRWAKERLSPPNAIEEVGNIKAADPDLFSFIAGMGKLKLRTALLPDTDSNYIAYVHGFVFMKKLLDDHFFLKSVVAFELEEEARFGYFNDLIEIEHNRELVESLKELVVLPKDSDLHPSSLKNIIRYDLALPEFVNPVADSFRINANKAKEQMLHDERLLAKGLQSDVFIDFLSVKGSTEDLAHGASDCYGIAKKKQAARQITMAMNKKYTMPKHKL